MHHAKMTDAQAKDSCNGCDPSTWNVICYWCRKNYCADCSVDFPKLGKQIATGFDVVTCNGCKRFRKCIGCHEPTQRPVCEHCGVCRRPGDCMNCEKCFIRGQGVIAYGTFTTDEEYKRIIRSIQTRHRFECGKRGRR